MLKLLKNRIVIKFKSKYLEEDIRELDSQLKKFDFKKNIKDQFEIDASMITSIDFFAFQYLYYFIKYLKDNNIYKEEKIKFENKSEIFIEFEKKIGLTL